VVNVNSPDDYRAARRCLLPLVTVQRGGTVTTNDHTEPRTVRAATLAGAAAAVGLSLDSYMVAELNGDQIGLDGDVPLVSGDAIAFNYASADDRAG
jgi:molybdopterin-guanine dinucleotide biosynthesis protein A